MNSRERVLAVLNREPVDRLPVDIWHTDEILQSLLHHYKANTELELYRKMQVDKIVWNFPIYVPPNQEGAAGSGHFGEAACSMWGTPLKPVQAGEALYQEFGDPPLREFDTPQSIDRYPLWPDPERFDYDRMTRIAEEASREFVVLGPWVSFFEVYCQMRGLETAMMDLVLNPDLLNTTLDRIQDCQTEMMKRYLDRAARWTDLVFISDDMGNQQSLFMSLATWDRFFAKRLAHWCELVHSYGIKVFFHSDGAIGPLIPRLLDSGIDVLNPIQHVCPGMDRVELKKKYGRRVVFHGAIENQKTLPFGSPEEVREETRECLRTLGGGREGYIVCSCHNIQPGTPLENIQAMVETVHQHGAVE